MSKTVLTKVDGFTPIIDGIVSKYGYVAAMVFGVVWRYCQLKDNKCTASQETMASKIGIKRQTFNRNIKTLVENGYLIAETKDGIGVTYWDTGKANLSLKVTGTDEGVPESDSTCNGKLHVPVTLDDTKRLFKDIYKDTIYDPEIVFYRKITGLIPDVMAFDKVILDIQSAFDRSKKDPKEFETYMRGIYHNWCGTKTKEGRPYSPSNPKWIEWAISGRYLEDKLDPVQGKEKGFYA